MDTTKRILFLDDDRRRTHEFYQRLISEHNDITTVETAEECIAELSRQTFDLVSLDHDLGGEIFCDSSREDCGMEVVRWLRNNRAEHGGFIIHTMNPMAAAAMYIELQGMGYRVEQSAFGSPEYYQHVVYMLQDETIAQYEEPNTFGNRIAKYFRSLRTRR
jgi:ActR/RegA family two-component response regulator